MAVSSLMPLTARSGRPATVAGSHLAVRHRTRDGQAVVDVQGDVDVNSATWLQQRLLRLLREDAPRLVVDLSGVTFIDCYATRLLTEVSRHAEQQAGSVQYVAPSRWVRRVAELTGRPGLARTGTRPDRGAWAR